MQEITSMTTSVVRAATPARTPELRRWAHELARHFPGLSPVCVALLALWSCGMILPRCCGLSPVSLYLARGTGKSDNTTRQHLREFYQEAQAKAGAKRGVKRRDFAITGCFLP